MSDSRKARARQPEARATWQPRPLPSCGEALPRPAPPPESLSTEQPATPQQERERFVLLVKC